MKRIPTSKQKAKPPKPSERPNPRDNRQSEREQGDQRGDPPPIDPDPPNR